MSWFKKPVKVKCYDLDELAKILDWYRAQYLSRMADTAFEVTAVTRGIFSTLEDGPKILYFEVSVPYAEYKKLRDKFIASECFDPILEQRAFSEILGRGL